MGSGGMASLEFWLQTVSGPVRMKMHESDLVTLALTAAVSWSITWRPFSLTSLISQWSFHLEKDQQGTFAVWQTTYRNTGLNLSFEHVWFLNCSWFHEAPRCINDSSRIWERSEPPLATESCEIARAMWKVVGQLIELWAKHITAPVSPFSLGYLCGFRFKQKLQNHKMRWVSLKWFLPSYLSSTWDKSTFIRSEVVRCSSGSEHGASFAIFSGQTCSPQKSPPSGS